MILSIGSKISKEVKDLYSRDSSAKAIFDLFSQRQKDANFNTAERVAYSAEVPYSEVVRVFRELAEIGCGRFISGRKGYKTRIEWSYKIRSLAAAAKGDASTVDELDSEDVDAEDEFDLSEVDHDLLSHPFQLRADLAIELRLPSDLSSREAERLATFIRSLPFE